MEPAIGSGIESASSHNYSKLSREQSYRFLQFEMQEFIASVNVSKKVKPDANGGIILARLGQHWGQGLPETTLRLMMMKIVIASIFSELSGEMEIFMPMHIQP